MIMNVIKQHKKLFTAIVIIIVLVTINIIRSETDPAYKLLKPVINSSERNTNIISYAGYDDHDLKKGMYTYHFSINEKSEQDIGDEIKLLYDLINNHLSSITNDKCITIRVTTPRYEHGAHCVIVEFKNYCFDYNTRNNIISDHIYSVRGRALDNDTLLYDRFPDSEINYCEYWQYFNDAEILDCPEKHNDQSNDKSFDKN